MENTEENCEMILTIWRKSKLKFEKIWNSEQIWEKRKKAMLNSEMIWKIWKKIVKRFGKYGRNVS